ncbi:MAG: hypothetical protein ACWGQW_01680 [bacterium]
MAKTQSMTKAQLEAALAEAQERNASLAKENSKLRQNRRPEGALVLTGNVTFPKGSGKQFLGSDASQTIKTESGLVLHIVGNWKESGSGNCTARLTGWIDPRRVSLVKQDGSASDKATKSFKEQVVDGQ